MPAASPRVRPARFPEKGRQYSGSTALRALKDAKVIRQRGSVPPTIIVTYETAMLAALLATLVAGFLSIGLARFWKRKVFDPRIHEGKIAVCAYVTPGDQARRAAGALSGAGGTDVRIEEGVL